jgi:DNA-binding response OmpR family regulator
VKVLLVEDDRDLVDLLTFTMERVGFQLIAAHESPAALRLLAEQQPDAVVLDVNLGKWNGFDLLRTMRLRTDIPLIMLTAHDGEDDKVRGLELGADDYIVKPFSHRELIARIRSHLRRAGREWVAPKLDASRLTAGPLELNLREHAATKDGQPLDLTVTEFRMLHFLMSNAGAVVPSSAILKHVWGHDTAGGSETVRVTLHRLRRKIEEDPNSPVLLRTVPGVGVILKAEGAADPSTLPALPTLPLSAET